jgi:hypothetical protein
MLVGGYKAAIAQDATTDLSVYFKQRLTSDAGPPSYDALLKVIDTIPALDKQTIQNALPVLSTALVSTKENLAIEAAFALHEIARRPDGGALLRTKVPEIAGLLSRQDERFGGAAVEILKFLTPSDADLTIPAMIKFLNGPDKPTLVKAETVSALLRLRGNDPQTKAAVEQFVMVTMDPEVHARTLQVIGLNHVRSAGINNFFIQSLGDADSNVKIAAISIARQLGPDSWTQASPIITKLATSPTETIKVKSVAERAIQNNLDQPVGLK